MIDLNKSLAVNAVRHTSPCALHARTIRSSVMVVKCGGVVLSSRQTCGVATCSQAFDSVRHAFTKVSIAQFVVSRRPVRNSQLTCSKAITELAYCAAKLAMCVSPAGKQRMADLSSPMRRRVWHAHAYNVTYACRASPNLSLPSRRYIIVCIGMLICVAQFAPSVKGVVRTVVRSTLSHCQGYALLVA
jgi:hypothetical protein